VLQYAIEHREPAPGYCSTQAMFSSKPGYPKWRVVRGMRYAPCWPHLATPLLVRAKRGKEREDAGAAERERWPATAPHLGAEEQGQQPAEGGGRGVTAELWGPPPRRRVRSSATCCACAGAKGGEEPDPDPAGRAAALAPAAAGGSLEKGSSRPSRLCAAPRGGQKPRATRALALGVSRFFPYCSYCSTEGSSLAARFDPLLALGVGLAPVRHWPRRRWAPGPARRGRRTGVPQPPPVAAARLPWPPPSSRVPAAARRRERSREEALGREEMRAGRIWVPLLGCLAPPAGSSCGGGGRWGGLRI
jgi:hypothetical protein